MCSLRHRIIVAVAAAVGLTASLTWAQTLIDRVLVRIDGYAITLTDVRAAAGLGLIEARTEGEDAIQQVIDRHLLLTEVARFPPPEPPAATVAQEIARQRAAAGGQLDALMQSTGVDEAQLRDMARDTLRIQAYVTQRFGGGVPITDAEAELYYQMHPNEFRVNGALPPFETVVVRARERAAEDRRRSAVTRWLQDLRGRAGIVRVQH